MTESYNISKQEMTNFRTPYGINYHRRKQDWRITKLIIVLALILIGLSLASHMIGEVNTPLPSGVEQHL